MPTAGFRKKGMLDRLDPSKSQWKLKCLSLIESLQETSSEMIHETRPAPLAIEMDIWVANQRDSPRTTWEIRGMVSKSEPSVALMLPLWKKCRDHRESLFMSLALDWPSWPTVAWNPWPWLDHLPRLLPFERVAPWAKAKTPAWKAREVTWKEHKTSWANWENIKKVVQNLPSWSGMMAENRKRVEQWSLNLPR